MPQQSQSCTESLRIPGELLFFRLHWMSREVSSPVSERMLCRHDRPTCQQAWRQAGRQKAKLASISLPLIWAPTERCCPHGGSVSFQMIWSRKIPRRSSWGWGGGTGEGRGGCLFLVRFKSSQVDNNQTFTPCQVTSNHSSFCCASFPDENSDKIIILPTRDTTAPHITKH